MKNISENIADILWSQGIIQKEDIDKCKYGIDIFFSSFLEIFSILLIAAFIGNFIVSPSISYPAGGSIGVSSASKFKRMSPNPYLSFEV